MCACNIVELFVTLFKYGGTAIGGLVSLCIAMGLEVPSVRLAFY